MIFSGRICAIEKDTCKWLINCAPSLRDLQCEDCPDHKIRLEKTEIDPRLYSLLFLDLMKAGGYQFDADELTVDQWMGLGVIAQERANSALGRGSWLAKM